MGLGVTVRRGGDGQVRRRSWAVVRRPAGADRVGRAGDSDGYGTARKAADRAEERLRPVADYERRRAGWLERTSVDRSRAQAVTRELATRKQAGARAWNWTRQPGSSRRSGAQRSSGHRTGARRGDRQPRGSRPTGTGSRSPTSSAPSAPKDLERRLAYKRVQEAAKRARGEELEAKVVELDRARARVGDVTAVSGANAAPTANPGK
jgi:hypothetical protein